ncbi:helix-turn-helix transcriptional regulator [Clostridium sp. OS1-26]|uniref:helix-turn-helix domain-containing protein n=1 Tax=Clostridium sp. OS1-26 TaxID=3070681 RepID=UPI0027E14DED|nr:helix-turn-helix transcriptional regulator [Clostridium sp. OS1-26]WML35671.1 helix-turn-helix transcriptional regulator [Clostridium sp. OS1-26]
MFKERLKELRECKGLTQSQLSEELKIGRASISNYELGTRIPDIDVLIKISKYFNVTTDYLTGQSKFKTLDEAIKMSSTNELLKDSISKLSVPVNNGIIKQLSSILETILFLLEHDNKYAVDFCESISYLIDLYKSLVDFVENQEPVELKKYKEELQGTLKNSLDYHPENKYSNEIFDELKSRIKSSITYSRYYALKKRCPELFKLLNNREI